ncbi:MAG: hypothetical protein JWN14_4710 [Chthonomonadales bacterium]|nr:hypothetical protein [Chthonomonadales bacterium]
MKFIHVRLVLVFAPLSIVLPMQTQAQSYKTWPEADLYTHGKDRVLKGRDLEQAIKALAVLVERKPGDADYQMTLGCACVSRLAALHCAAEDIQILEAARRAYQKRLKVWQAMQEDASLPLFGKPQPVAPVAPFTPDDGKAYDATVIARNSAPTLALQALHSFREALRLGRSLAPKHKTEIDYTCGWGLLMLYKNGKENLRYQEAPTPVKPEDAKQMPPPNPDENTLLHDEIIACFQACAVADRKKADYWQSLAFAYAPDYVTDILSNFDEEKIDAKTNRCEEAGKSLQRALTLKRADPDLLYQAALLASRSLPDQAVDNLKKLTRVQKANAVNFYLLAEACLRQSEHLAGSRASQARQDALMAIESGNHAPEYYNVAMILPLPKPLTSAWNYRHTYGFGLDSYCIDSLFGFLADVGSNDIKRKDGDALMQCSISMMDMALNALRHYEGADMDPTDLRTHNILYNRAFFGMVSCGKAYKWIQTAATLSPNPTNASMPNTYAQSAEYGRAWDKALIQ